jgi:hypothetical protein
MNKNILLSTLCALISVGCASGHCRSKKSSDARSVFVYKSDGTLQCGQGKEISTVDMSKELDGITIRSQNKREDGQMHAMMCGGASGKINVFEIAEKDLALAQKKGFKVLVEK